jgi:hypothetical protein
MTTNSNQEKSKEIEIDLIISDAYFYDELMRLISSKQSNGILIFGIIPYISLFTIESYTYIKKVLPHHLRNLSKNNEKIIRNARMRLKFFDDSNNRVDGTFYLLDEISEFLKDWFINSHKGSLASIRKKMQPDMGISFYGNHIVGSTHTGLLLSGLEKLQISEEFEDTRDKNGKTLYMVAKELGEYLGWLKRLPEFESIKTNNFKYEFEDSQFYYQDVKSDEFFSSIFNKNDQNSINLSLLLFLSIVNFIDHIFVKIIPEDVLYSFFKIKFITLYHLASSLKKLESYCYPKNFLSNESKEFLKKILKDKDLKMIQSKTELRNILVHYKIEKNSDLYFSGNFNFKNLIEYFFDGHTFEEIDKKLNYQIKRISSILEQWSNWSLDSSKYSRYF